MESMKFMIQEISLAMDSTGLSGMAEPKHEKCNIIVCLKSMEMEETIFLL